MNKKQMLAKIEKQQEIINRLQIKICGGKHEYIEVKVDEVYSERDIDYYHMLQCKNCENTIIRRS